MADKQTTLVNKRPNRNKIKLVWEKTSTDGLHYWYEVKVPAFENIPGHYCFTAEQRPGYCDRGQWSVKVYSAGVFDLDGQEGFPRYYFSLENLIEEMEAWVNKRDTCINAYERNKAAATVPAD